VTAITRSPMILPLRLPSALAWLVDDARSAAGPDRFLAALGAQLIDDGLPLAGGALTLAPPHPIIARRRLAVAGGDRRGDRSPGLWGARPGPVWARRCRPRMAAGLGAAVVQEDIPGSAPDDPVLAWAAYRQLTEQESALLHQAARFCLSTSRRPAARSTLAALLEAYLGRRSAAQVLGGKLRRETGETIRAVLLYGDSCAASPRSRRPLRPKRWSPPSAPGSTASPAPFMPSAARC